MSGDQDPKEQSPETPQERRARLRFDYDNYIEELIQEGKENGVFDNLKGAGKPLNLNKNPYGQDQEIAHNLLRQNDMLPAWIMNRRGILAEREAIRGAIAEQWARYQPAFQYAQADSQRAALRLGWDDLCQAWERQMVKLNKRIRDFNLGRPSGQLEIIQLTLEYELERVGGQRYLG